MYEIFKINLGYLKSETSLSDIILPHVLLCIYTRLPESSQFDGAISNAPKYI